MFNRGLHREPGAGVDEQQMCVASLAERCPARVIRVDFKYVAEVSVIAALPTQNAASYALSEAFVAEGAGVQLRQHRRCQRRTARFSLYALSP